MASNRWRMHATQAAVVAAVIGAIGSMASAWISRSCPDRCSSTMSYAASFAGKPLPAKLQAQVDQCLGGQK